MKKIIMTAALTAAIGALGATAAFAQTVEKVDVEGVKFEIPEDIRDLVTVETEGLDAGTLVSVSETASIEAAKESGQEADGAGWLFSISKISEDEMKKARCSGVDGMDIFAEDDDIYYVYNHPTDVRLIRENAEEFEKAEEAWINLNDWANNVVCDEIVKNNAELDKKNYSNTGLDCDLCKIAFDDGTKYEIRTLEYPNLDASTFKDKDYIEDLTEDVFYEYIDKPEVTDGEYIVLDFPDSGIRYEFLKSDENVIREVITTDDEEIVYYYGATFEDKDDTATGIMQEWCDAIANGEDEDDD